MRTCRCRSWSLTPLTADSTSMRFVSAAASSWCAAARSATARSACLRAFSGAAETLASLPASCLCSLWRLVARSSAYMKNHQKVSMARSQLPTVDAVDASTWVTAGCYLELGSTVGKQAALAVHQRCLRDTEPQTSCCPRKRCQQP